ncbi:type I 3-dehydroquinate dehydratase [Candidatus Gracilibacteria bacterium]|nr:type I 3-dehydroquinate dehydratase [Candidatus Gracilibacteria bacterium]
MICVPLKNQKTLLKDIQEAEKIADLTEICFDSFSEDFDIDQVFKKAKKPILYKCIDHQNMEKVLAFKPHYIDLDIATESKVISKVIKLSPKTKIILSHHDFKKTPSTPELKSLITKMFRRKAHIAKIAATAKSFEDSLRILELLAQISPKKKVILIAMSKHGQITRSTGHLFGNYLMYAPLSEENKTASGQITAKELNKIICLSK